MLILRTFGNSLPEGTQGSQTTGLLSLVLLAALAGCEAPPSPTERARSSLPWDIAECRDTRTGETFRYRRENILAVTTNPVSITIEDEDGFRRTATARDSAAYICRDGGTTR